MEQQTWHLYRVEQDQDIVLLWVSGRRARDGRFKFWGPVWCRGGHKLRKRERERAIDGRGEREKKHGDCDITRSGTRGTGRRRGCCDGRCRVLPHRGELCYPLFDTAYFFSRLAMQQQPWVNWSSNDHICSISKCSSSCHTTAACVLKLNATRPLMLWLAAVFLVLASLPQGVFCHPLQTSLTYPPPPPHTHSAFFWLSPTLFVLNFEERKLSSFPPHASCDTADAVVCTHASIHMSRRAFGRRRRPGLAQRQ